MKKYYRFNYIVSLDIEADSKDYDCDNDIELRYAVKKQGCKDLEKLLEKTCYDVDYICEHEFYKECEEEEEID